MPWKTRRHTAALIAKRAAHPRPRFKPPVKIIEPYDGLYTPETYMPKLSNYIDLVEIRELDVEGTKGKDGYLEDEDRWIWIKTDYGAWDGPHRDWASSHADKYFKYLKKRDVCISAGANQGMYIRFYAKKFGTVYAFEPDPLNFHCMVINNQVDNVVKMHAALGEENGWCSVMRNGFDNTGSWTVAALPKGAPDISGEMRVPIIAIDTMNFETVDLIQLDLEGYEDRALTGAIETINRCKPVIIVENGYFDRIMQLMDALHYKHVDQSVADRIFVPEDY